MFSQCSSSWCIWMAKLKLQYINIIEHDNVAFSSLSMFLIRIWLHLIWSIGIFTDILSLCLYIFFTTQIWIQFMRTEDWKTDIHLNPVELRRLEGHILSWNSECVVHLLDFYSLCPCCSNISIWDDCSLRFNILYWIKMVVIRGVHGSVGSVLSIKVKLNRFNRFLCIKNCCNWT